MIDALANGCIPLVFLEASPARQLWPWHFFGWREDAMLNIRPGELLGKGAGRSPLDLIAFLRKIPPARVAAMQRAIMAYGQRLAYLTGPYDGEDGVDILLKGLAFGLPGR